LFANNVLGRTSDEFPLLLSNVSKSAEFSWKSFISALYHGRITQLTEHDDVIKPLLRGAPRLCLALIPAPAWVGPVNSLFRGFH